MIKQKIHRDDLLVFLSEVEAHLGKENLISERSQIYQKINNSLGHSVEVHAIVFPSTKLDVHYLINLANRYNIPLYIVSRGKNIGYGEMCPPCSNQVVLSLEKMTKICNFDPEAGEVTLEPGVSQDQLVKFLQEQGDQWIADVTGAPPDSSIVGNTLDGGFGHSPLGNRREHILEVQGVLGHGDFFKTGEFPALGPNLAPLFIQSNFGIVTSLRVRLLRRPESILTYVIQFKNHERFLAAIPVLLELRQLGIIQSLLHIANATRVFMSSNYFPSHLSKKTVLSDQDCINLMKIPFTKPTMWSGIGGLYGSRKQVKMMSKILESRLKPFGKIRYFSTSKFKFLRFISKLICWKSSRTLDIIKNSLDSIESFHKLCKGIPSRAPAEHVLWKAQNTSDLGLIWISPVIKASNKYLNELLILIRPVFEEFNFEFPLTVTLIDHAHLACILNLCFDKSDPNEVIRAHLAHEKINELLKANNIGCYRKNILYQGGIPKDRLETISLIKLAFDPKGIIAPGRYGILPQGGL
ncbi:MAG: FAD-binding oxidoreductase [Bdellovibrionaceae bacterium]|nr:FAD-binding oxidoreductase [Pseudobdellovibrionaceae bacterium]